MCQILFTSLLRDEYRTDLENLMFFNPQQSKVKSAIVQCIEEYGLPEIFVEGKFLRVKVQGFSDVQTLFALDQNEGSRRLAGVMVYVRNGIDNMLLLHIGVDESYSISGPNADEMVVMRLIIKLKEIARRIKGVHSLTVLYGNGLPTKISV